MSFVQRASESDFADNGDQQPHRTMHEPSPSSSAFTPPTPPPVSSSAALPPFQLGHAGAGDIKRHQSLNHGYGRVRERLERTSGLLSMDQRDDARRRPGTSSSESHEAPPTSPIGPSMWSAQAGENGWTSLNQLSDQFDSLQLNRRIAEHNGGGGGGVGYQGPSPGPGQRRAPEHELLPPMPQTAGPIGEPSWVAGLVGHDVAPQVRSAHAASWQDRDALLRQHQQGMLPPHHQQQQPRWDQGHVPLAYLQQQQQQQLLGSYGRGQYPGYAPSPQPGYMPAPMYPSPPVSAHMLGPQDQAVIELARAKGLNPATYNCRPHAVSSFLPDYAVA